MQILFRASHHRRDDDSLKFVPLALTDRPTPTRRDGEGGGRVRALVCQFAALNEG